MWNDNNVLQEVHEMRWYGMIVVIDIVTVYQKRFDRERETNVGDAFVYGKT